MAIGEHASMHTVIRETVSALKEAARHIDKAEGHVTEDQLKDIEAGVEDLLKALKRKTGKGSDQA